MESQFWGVVLQPDKMYEQTVESSFHVSMAAVESSNIASKVTSVFVEAGGDEFLICNLNNSNLNVHLDLNFIEGEKIGFRATGPGTVHLTGYLIPDTDDVYGDLDSESECIEDEEEEAPVLVNGKGKNTKRKPDNSLIDTPNKKAKKELELARAKKVQSDLNSKKKSQKKVESSDDDDDNMEAEDDTSDDGILDFTENYAEEEDSAEESDDEYEDDSSSEEADSPQTKKILEKVADKKKEASPITPKNKKKKDNASTPKGGTTPNSAVKEQPKNPKSPKSVNVNGIQCEDIRVGSGPDVKKGKIIGMYYDGRLKNNNKRFDATLNGKPFKFRLGAGEVIKGWDLGLEGMKVGGRRRLTIPPKLAYGAQGAPPDIPPNSTLVFEVECKFVK